MSPSPRSRRSLLRRGGTLAAAIGTGTVAGCISSPGNDGSPGRTETAPLADVPPTGEAVFTADVDAVLADDGVRTAYNAWLQARAEMPDYDGPTDLTGLLDDLANREGFDVRDLSTITGFLSYGDERRPRASDGTGYIFEGAWDASTALSTVNHETLEYSEATYGDRTIYRPVESTYAPDVGVLGDGKYVVGGPGAVRGAIDVARGDAEPIGGAVADAYRESRDGPIRFATPVRESWIPDSIGGDEEPTDLSAVQAIETAAGAVYRDGNARGVGVSLNTPDAATAKQLDDTLRAVLTVARNRAKSTGLPAFVRSLIGDVSVGRTGSTVTATVERTVAEIEEIATTIAEQSGHGSGGMGGTERVPQVRFDFAYDRQAGTVTITHAAGDAVPAENLLVDGEGFAEGASADMTSAGQWAGTTTDEGRVTDGDHVAVGVNPDYRLVLVWEAENVSATLSMHEGPDA